MKHSTKWLWAAFAATLSMSVYAHSGHGHHGHHHHHEQKTFGDASTASPPVGVTVNDCWIRLLPNRLPSAAYFVMDNSGHADAVLVGAEAANFGKVMLHTHQTINGMATMVHADKVIVPVGGSFEFAPGGHHVMLEQPKATLNIGHTSPITFWFEDSSAITTDCEIRSPASLN